MAEATRRQVLGGSIAGAGALALGGCGEVRFPGTLGGADWQRGHLLREGKYPAPDGPAEVTGVLIAGGGAAGLAAAWRLAEAWLQRFRPPRA